MPVTNDALIVADDVVSALNGGTFSVEFTAERVYRIQLNLETMGDSLYVHVVPRSREIESLTRSGTQREIVVDVAIRQHMAEGAGNDDLDALMNLAQEIADFFGPAGTAKLDGGAAWLRTEHEPLFDPPHLDQANVFFSVISFTFKLL
jgi:hypothetical protein